MPSSLWSRLKQNALLTLSGGSWSENLPQETRKNLRWFFLDGGIGACLDGVVAPFLSVYLLALGATSSNIGLMTSLAGLSGTLMLLPGAMLAERTGKRKLLFALCGAGFARFTILISGLLPFFLSPSTAIAVMIILKVIADGLGNFSGPAWTSLAGDVVPPAWRGRYFGARNFFMSVTGMAATDLAGLLISHFRYTLGYQVAFMLAFLAGLISTTLFLQVHDPGGQPATESVALRPALRSMAADPYFRHYALFGLIWNLSIGVAGPYFVIYLVQNLKGTPTDVSLYNIAASLAALPALRLFGSLSDSWGMRKVMLLTGFLIPLVPSSWILARLPWHAILINAFAGLVWGGFNLCSFNLLLSMAPSDKRARYAAFFQVVVALSSATGTFFGSLIIARFSYLPIFVISAVGRLVGIIYFTRFVRPTDREPLERPRTA